MSLESPADDAEASRPEHRISETRRAIFALVRDTKWLTAVSILLSGLLYFPSQVQELYRSIIADADQDFFDLALFHFSLVLIAFFIWFGANQVAAASRQRTRSTPSSNFFARFWPALIGAAPLVFSGLGQIASMPTRFDQAQQRVRDLQNTPGSVWDKLDVDLAQSVGHGLLWSGRFSLALSLMFVGLIVIFSEKFEPAWRKLNDAYFGGLRALLVTVIFIGILTASFILSPVYFPQFLGAFGIVAAFALCIVLFCTHLSLMTIHYRFPFIPLLLVCATIFSMADLNDNHNFREFQQSSAVPKLDEVDAAFDKWLSKRPDTQNFTEEYPVYVVAAQGGGIYAANQAALFLARLQDACPAFRDHLFAISSVSGGSIGASIFASALRATKTPSASVSAKSDPCPDITRFLHDQYLPSDNKPKAVEKYIHDVLSSDFLSPLLAATFFSDFSQRFLPMRASFLFDRATAFEFSLETAAEKVSSVNLLKQNYLTHWSPDTSTPALLLNATDVGSGRRVLFSPFLFGVAGTADTVSNKRNQEFGNDSLLHFESLRASLSRPGMSLRLSTAAGISARFPWVSPPATIEPESGTLFGAARKIRLVDGGYVDNSGVETALDLREALEPKIAQINAEMDAKRAANPNGDRKYPRVVLKLIVLGGGSYPTRTSFGLDEPLEPIRALLSTRQSRAYVAINRASRLMPPASHPVSVQESTESVITSNLRIAKLENQYYDLPLGWTISQKTRDIIRRQSGRYWDCEFNNNFTQSSAAGVSETDCVQLVVYHELSQSMATAIKDTAVANHYGALSDKARPERLRFNDFEKNEIIRCYASDQPAWRLSQSLILHALVDEWSHYPDNKDVRQLAYILGTAAHETSTFRVFSQSLSFSDPDRIFRFARSTRHKLETVEAAQPYINQPEMLANYVYGNRPDLGNIIEGDGWRYRARGIFPITGRSNYQTYASRTSTPLEEDPDLMLNRNVAARVAFAFFFNGARNILSPYFSESTESWTGARAALPGLPKINGLPEGTNEVAAEGMKFYHCITKLPQRAVL